MQRNDLFGLLFVAMGLFSALGGGLNWAFFMHNRKAQRMVSLFGHNGARGFYVVLGVALMGLGIAFALGVIPEAPPGPR